MHFYHRCKPVVTIFTASANVSVFVWISEWCTAVLCFMSAVSPFLLSVSPFFSCSVHDATGPCRCVKGSRKLHVLAQFVKVTAAPIEKTSSSLQDDEVKVKVVLTNDISASATV
jgi:hypothetical protein